MQRADLVAHLATRAKEQGPTRLLLLFNGASERRYELPTHTCTREQAGALEMKAYHQWLKVRPPIPHTLQKPLLAAIICPSVAHTT